MSSNPPEPPEPIFDVAEGPAAASVDAADAGPTWLTEEDFLPQTVEPALSPRQIGPGILEACGWITGAFALQIIGGVVAGVVIILIIASRSSQSMTELARGPELQRAILDHPAILLGIAQIVSVAGVIVASHLRLGRDRLRKLSFRGMNWRHLLIMLLAMLPIGMLSSQLHIVGQSLWDGVLSWFPGLEHLNETSSMKAIGEMAHNTNVLVLFLVVAVAPAIWEELVFRGVIGRGLVARYGVPTGVVVTSLLFAAMHLHPPHVFALLPLSVFMHVIYLATRTFWAPMLVHFLNNAMAITLLLAIDESYAEQAGQALEQGVSPIALVTSLACFAAFMVLLWKTRVTFRNDYGDEWTPGYETAESPPAHLSLRPIVSSVDGKYWALAILSLFVFLLGAGTTVDPAAGP